MEENIVMNQSPHLIDIIAIYIPTHEVTILFILFPCLVMYPSTKRLEYVLNIIRLKIIRTKCIQNMKFVHLFFIFIET